MVLQSLDTAYHPTPQRISSIPVARASSTRLTVIVTTWVCLDEPSDNENIGLERVEIYVK